MWKQRKPVIAILFSFLLPRYAIFYAYSFNISNLVHNLLEILYSPTTGPEAIMDIVVKSLQKFILPSLLISLAFFFLSSLLSLTVIDTVDTGLKKKDITIRNLMPEIWTKLKGVVVTQFYVYFLSLGYCSFSLSLILAVAMGGGLSVGSYLLASLMFILSFLLYVYLEFMWYQGIVVSVVERNYQGLAALGMSADIIRGRRALAFRTNFLVALFIGIVLLPFFLALKLLLKDDKSVLVVDFLSSSISLLLQIFSLAVYVVFYHECSSDPANKLDAQNELIYKRVSSAVPLGDDVV